MTTSGADDIAEPISRRCRECQRSFTISAAEQEWFARLAQRTGEAWLLPVRCTPCRFARRRGRERALDDGVDTTIICVACGTTFNLSSGEKRHYASRDWLMPRRCRACRDARRHGTDRPLLQ